MEKRHVVNRSLGKKFSVKPFGKGSAFFVEGSSEPVRFRIDREDGSSYLETTFHEIVSVAEGRHFCYPKPDSGYFFLAREDFSWIRLVSSEEPYRRTLKFVGASYEMHLVADDDSVHSERVGIYVRKGD